MGNKLKLRGMFLNHKVSLDISGYDRYHFITLQGTIIRDHKFVQSFWSELIYKAPQLIGSLLDEYND